MVMFTLPRLPRRIRHMIRHDMTQSRRHCHIRHCYAATLRYAARGHVEIDVTTRRSGIGHTTHRRLRHTLRYAVDAATAADIVSDGDDNTLTRRCCRYTRHATVGWHYVEVNIV